MFDFLKITKQTLMWFVVLGFNGTYCMAGGVDPDPTLPIFVDTTRDINLGGECTLRTAIESANGDVAIGGCNRGNGSDVIVLQAGGPDTPYTLEDDLPEITESVSIIGPSSAQFVESGNPLEPYFIAPGADFSQRVIDGGNEHRLFVVDLEDDGIVFMSGFTINRGNAGGIESSPNLFSGGGLFIDVGSEVVAVAISITGSIANGGGGIALRNSVDGAISRLTLLDSNVSGNRSIGPAGGGGIRAGADSELTIGHTSIVRNRAQALTGSGGGLTLFQIATANIYNSTISANTASRSGGGIWIRPGERTSIALRHDTITSNVANADLTEGGRGGGIEYSDTDRNYLELDNTIVAGNAVQLTLEDIFRVTATFEMGLITKGQNYIGVNRSVEAIFPPGLPNATGDFAGTPANNIVTAASLRSLTTVNGRSFVPFDANSLLIDNAGQCGFRFDQVFTERPVCGCDIGAVERPDPNPDETSCLGQFYVIPIPGRGSVVVPL